VDAAVGLKHKQAGTLQEVCLDGCEEVVVVNDCITLLQLLLGPVKVVVHKQALHELQGTADTQYSLRRMSGVM
jgi:hypothetical protein